MLTVFLVHPTFCFLLLVFFVFKLYICLSIEFLQPYKRRPETTAVVARRMLTGALGLKTKASKEQREKEIEEKQKLKQAKGG